MSDSIQQRHQRHLIAMRSHLEAKGYYRALDALELVRESEQGVRKDGVTPKFHHQLSVAKLLVTYEPMLMYPEETITCALLHDELENNRNHTRETLRARFGDLIADATWRLTKKTPDGLTKSYELYFGEIAQCPISSVVKPGDRGHNLNSMVGVFKPQKQLEYVGEVYTHFFPMMKIARRKYPQQFKVYENLKYLLRCQCNLIKAMHAPSDTPPTAS